MENATVSEIVEAPASVVDTINPAGASIDPGSNAPADGTNSSVENSSEEKINSTAIPVSPEQIIEKRGRGRPKGSGKKKPVEHGQATIGEILGENNNGGESGENESVISDGAPIPEADPNAQPTTETISVTDYQAMAGLTVAMGTSTLAMIFGPEWQPEDDNERTQLTIAVAKYMESKQVQDIPPGALLAIVLLTYSAKRFRAPTTREKVKGAWFWIKSKFGRKKNNLVAMPSNN